MKKKLGVLIILLVIALVVSTNITFAEEVITTEETWIDKYLVNGLNAYFSKELSFLGFLLAAALAGTGITAFSFGKASLPYTNDKIKNYILGISICLLVIGISAIAGYLIHYSNRYLGMPLVIIATIMIFTLSLLDQKNFKLIVIGSSVALGFLTIFILLTIVLTANGELDFFEENSVVDGLFSFSELGVVAMNVIALIQMIFLKKKIMKKYEEEKENVENANDPNPKFDQKLPNEGEPKEFINPVPAVDPLNNSNDNNSINDIDNKNE